MVVGVVEDVGAVVDRAPTSAEEGRLQEELVRSSLLPSPPPSLTHSPLAPEEAQEMSCWPDHSRLVLRLPDSPQALPHHTCSVSPMSSYVCSLYWAERPEVWAGWWDRLGRWEPSVPCTHPASCVSATGRDPTRFESDLISIYLVKLESLKQGEVRAEREGDGNEC